MADGFDSERQHAEPTESAVLAGGDAAAAEAAAADSSRAAPGDPARDGPTSGGGSLNASSAGPALEVSRDGTDESAADAGSAADEGAAQPSASERGSGESVSAGGAGAEGQPESEDRSPQAAAPGEAQTAEAASTQPPDAGASGVPAGGAGAPAAPSGAGGIRAADGRPKSRSKRAPLPGPEVKRGAKKAPKKTTTQEKLATAERRQAERGRRPLDGVRVLDLSRLLPGPYASHILASFGAEVIKVEKPGEGDYMREFDPKSQGFNAAFLTINRGKQSLAIDLKNLAGKEAFIALANKSDVVLDGFRPGVMDRLGLGYESLRESNPRLIYAALTGYGQTGALAEEAGHDLNYIALAGMLDLLGEADGMPAVPGVQIADVAAGALPTVIGILLALQDRTRSGTGQMVDISMFDSILGLMPVQVANYTATKRRPRRGYERLFGRYACYGIYPVRNGRYVAVAALEPKFWEALCTAMNRPDLIEDQYAEGDAQEILKAELTRSFQKKDVNEWMEIFAEYDACVTEVREISRVVQDDGVAERDMVTPVRGKGNAVYEQLGVFPKLSDSPGYIQGDPPARGEHTRQLLRSLDYDDEKIDEMLAAEVVEQAGAG